MINKKEYQKNWRKQNKYKIIKYKKEFYLKNKEKISKTLKKYYIRNRKKLLKYQKEYRQKNIVKILKKQKKHRERNKKYYKEYGKKYKNNRRKRDIGFKILCNLRTRLWDALKSSNKSKSTVKLLGCSVKQLRQRLESKFKKGMTWRNYGKGWEIDHIIPCASFDLSKKSEQCKCFNYTNLQPLTIKENRSKGGKKK